MARKIMMRPGQLTLNSFEAAIMERLVANEPRLANFCDKLHVLSREFTGVGSFTNFHCEEVAEDERWTVCLGEHITMPCVENGMGAVLCCCGQHPQCLETFTYGGDCWDGVHYGFGFDESD
jgi:hypothetical protein